MTEKGTDDFDFRQGEAGAAPAPGLKPWMFAVIAAAAAGLVVLNFGAALFGDEVLWLKVANIAANLGVLAAGLFMAVRMALASQAESAEMHRALSASQVRLAAIVESAMDAIISLDESQRIVLFNRAAEQVFHCRREEMLGQPLDRLLPTRFRQAHRSHVQSFGRTGTTSRRMGDATTLWALRGDGSEEFPIEASISHSSEGGRQFFTVILRDITVRKRVTDALARQQDELRQLSAQVHDAREEEKTRIARELHDELGQLLTALKMDLSWLNEKLPAGSPAVGEKIQRMGEALDRLVHSVRRISSDLRPLMLDDLGLADAAGWLVDEFAQRSGIECRFELKVDQDLTELDKKLANTLYRALQESLTNIARHAGARHAWILLAADDAEIRLEVEDDGCGVDSADLAKAQSFGLKGMRERVSFADGQMEIARAPRGGTRVRISLPLRMHSRAELPAGDGE